MFPQCTLLEVFIINGVEFYQNLVHPIKMIIWLLFFNLMYHTDLQMKNPCRDWFKMVEQEGPVLIIF